MNDVLGWFELIIIETYVVVNYSQRIICQSNRNKISIIPKLITSKELEFVNRSYVLMILFTRTYFNYMYFIIKVVRY